MCLMFKFVDQICNSVSIQRAGPHNQWTTGSGGATWGQKGANAPLIIILIVFILGY
jgi:hypothetical protein